MNQKGTLAQGLAKTYLWAALMPNDQAEQMANGFRSLPGSSGVYFVPKIWSHSMAGCPLQSALWKESEGRVRSEEMGGRGPEEEPNWLSWTSSILQ